MSNLPAQPKVFPFLTIVNERTPKQKMHTALGHAKSAFWDFSNGQHRTGQLYKWSGGGWELLYEIPKQTETYQEEVTYGNHTYKRTRYKDTRPWKAEE